MCQFDAAAGHGSGLRALSRFLPDLVKQQVAGAVHHAAAEDRDFRVEQTHEDRDPPPSVGGRVIERRAGVLTNRAATLAADSEHIYVTARTFIEALNAHRPSGERRATLALHRSNGPVFLAVAMHLGHDDQRSSRLLTEEAQKDEANHVLQDDHPEPTDDQLLGALEVTEERAITPNRTPSHPR